MKKEFLEIGKFVGTHGVRGMVRIQPWSDDGEFLTKFKNFYLDNGKTKIKMNIQAVWFKLMEMDK